MRGCRRAATWLGGSNLKLSQYEGTNGRQQTLNYVSSRILATRTAGTRVRRRQRTHKGGLPDTIVRGCR